MLTILTATVFYALAAGLAIRPPSARWIERLAPVPALLLHGMALDNHLFHGGSITIGINESISLFSWQSAALLWLLCLREPLRLAGSVIYPLAALGAIMATYWPTPASNIPIGDWKARTHILLSLLSAGMLTLAAVHGGLLAVQERLLHSHRLNRIARMLPPLQTMERLLFQLITIGFVLLSLTVLSGAWFIRDWMAQHLAHKIVLSIVAWLIFGVLLWGRHRYGWRGRTAITWTLVGYVMLILAYFGSKLVLEQVLGEHWS